MPIKPKGNALHLSFPITVGLIAFVLICSTAIPLLRSDEWWIRVFDFSRIQIASLMGLTLASCAALHLFSRLQVWEYAIAAVDGGSLLWQLFLIAPYTTFYPIEMSDSHSKEDSNRISLLIYNVLYDNPEVEQLTKQRKESRDR